MSGRFGRGAPPPPAVQETPWLPAGSVPVLFEQFAGLNTQASRAGIQDSEMSWCDGWMPIGPNNLRTIPDVGAAVAAAPAGTTIQFFDFVTIGLQPYCLFYPSDGSVWWFNPLNPAQEGRAAPPGTISNPQQNTIAVRAWGNQYGITIADQANGIFAWNGTTWYGPGQSVPNYSTLPTGIGGTALEEYSGRLWIMSGSFITFSAPGTFTDYATSDGGGAFQSTDPFLRGAWINARQTNGFLYTIGDSCVNYISGVVTSGSPPTTTFTNQNADPELGTPFAPSVQVLSRNIPFANEIGVHMSYGGAVNKVSDALDGIYNPDPANSLFGTYLPSSAKAIIFGKKVYIVLIPIIDPFTQQQVRRMFLWDEKRWFSSQQSVSLNFINCFEYNSKLTAYGTDGNFIYPLFQSASGNFTKTVQSKLFAAPGGYTIGKVSSRLFGLVNYNSTTSQNLNFTFDSELGSSGVTTVAPATPATGYFYIPPQAVAQNGSFLGLTITTNAADATLISTAFVADPYGYRG